MDRLNVLGALITQLQGLLSEITAASKDAASYATDSEAKADSKWDTQGLEASYLAAGQAAHARELAKVIAGLKGMKIASVQDTVISGSLVVCSMGDLTEGYLLCNQGGGNSIRFEGMEITMITPESALGNALIGKKRSSAFQLPSGLVGRIEFVG